MEEIFKIIFFHENPYRIFFFPQHGFSKCFSSTKPFKFSWKWPLNFFSWRRPPEVFFLSISSAPRFKCVLIVKLQNGESVMYLLHLCTDAKEIKIQIWIRIRIKSRFHDFRILDLDPCLDLDLDLRFWFCARLYAW